MKPALPVFDTMGESLERPPGARGRPVMPRAAATLLLLDRSGGEARVLMGRRHRGHDFMPDKWVFPGGRVDRGDFRRPAVSELTARAVAALSSTLSARRPTLARALGAAAVRETWEETGLVLGEPRAAGGPRPDLAALEVVGRAVTPPGQPKRFDAVFFAADAARLHDRDRVGGSGELDELAWFALDKALALDLPSVTRFILKETQARLAEPHRPALYMRFHAGRPRVSAFG